MVRTVGGEYDVLNDEKIYVERSKLVATISGILAKSCGPACAANLKIRRWPVIENNRSVTQTGHLPTVEKSSGRTKRERTERRVEDDGGFLLEVTDKTEQRSLLF